MANPDSQSHRTKMNLDLIRVPGLKKIGNLDGWDQGETVDTHILRVGNKNDRGT